MNNKLSGWLILLGSTLLVFLLDPPEFLNGRFEPLRRKKIEEWRRRGYSEHLIKMALMLADNYAYRMSRWLAKWGKLSPEQILPGLYEYALEHVAEHWIEKMGK